MSKVKATQPQKKETEYVVLHDFMDLEDGNKVYRKDKPFDAKGKSQKRIKELSTNANKLDKKLIEKRA